MHTLGVSGNVSGMEHIEWFTKVTTGDSIREVSRRAGIANKTLANQVNVGELKPENIIKIAEAYEESPVFALVDLGFISSRWITEPGTITALSRATDEQLTDELLRRLKLIDDAPIDDLAARRSNAPVPGVDWTAYGVADDSPEEGEGHPGDYEP